MKKITSLLLAVTAIIATTVSTNAGTKRYYLMSGDCRPTPVEIDWQNIRGLGSISGKIYGDGAPISLWGKNYAAGKLTLSWGSSTFYYTKKQVNGGFVWVNQYDEPLIPSERARQMIMAQKGKSHTPSGPTTQNRETRKSYGVYKDSGLRGQAELYWKNIQGNDTVRGTIDGTNVTGENYQSGVLKLRSTDGESAYYLTKQFHNGATCWRGTATYRWGTEMISIIIN